MSPQSSRAYTRPALLFLCATVLVGAWMRAALLYAPLTLDIPFRFIVHAHSHLAFFGWVTMMLFGAFVAALPVASQPTSFVRGHAVLLACASAAAFAAFLHGGYAMPAIALSVLNVALWMAFVAVAWRRSAGQPFWRAALAYLVIAGAATFAPLAVMLRGAGSAWWAELAVKLFLIPFINGWVTLGVMAAVAARCGYTGGRAARWLVVAGALPSTLLFIAAPPPHATLLLLGRAGAALVAAGSIAFAFGLRRRTTLENAWLHVGMAALAAKGIIELLAAAGVASTLMRSPPVVIAHLHLVLLGFVTASLLGTAVRGRALASAGVFAAGTALMLAALVASGWAALYLLIARTGIDLTDLLRAALGGGLLAAAGAIAAALHARPPAAPARPHPRPATTRALP